MRIRELLEKKPRAFQDAVVRVLKSSSSSRGAQFVVSLLVASDYLMPTLCDPALSLEEAISLAQSALQADPMMDVNLAKKLADNVVLGGQTRNAARLLDILGKISTGNRITSSLMRLLRTTDPQLRSKAVLLIGRGSRSVKWVQNRLSESDPRTRANAVEALWDVDTAEARELLRKAGRDGNNRVAGNALFALYRMGDTWVFDELFKMAASESPMFRSSAAWAMGETGDPRFSETLGRLVGETNAIVRKRAFAALARIKTAAKARQGREWRVAGRLLPGSGSTRQFRLEAGPTDGSAPPALVATQFILSVDGRLVVQYQVDTRAQAETLAVIFLFPRIADSASPPWVQGALECLPWKRPSDLWCATFYMPMGETSQAPPDSPPFTADRDAAATALQKAPSKMDCPGFWDAIRDSVQAASAPARGTRHLIAYSQSCAAEPTDMAEIVSAAMSSNTSVQVISPTRNAPLEELCRRTKGSFLLASSEAESSKLVEEAHLTLLSRFMVSCQPGPAARELNIRVAPTGWGETTIPL